MHANKHTKTPSLIFSNMYKNIWTYCRVTVKCNFKKLNACFM